MQLFNIFTNKGSLGVPVGWTGILHDGKFIFVGKYSIFRFAVQSVYKSYQADEMAVFSLSYNREMWYNLKDIV